MNARVAKIILSDTQRYAHGEHEKEVSSKRLSDYFYLMRSIEAKVKESGRWGMMMMKPSPQEVNGMYCMSMAKVVFECCVKSETSSGRARRMGEMK